MFSLGEVGWLVGLRTVVHLDLESMTIGAGTVARTFVVVIGAVGKAELEVVEQEEEVLAKVVIGTCMIEREEGVVGGEDIVCPIA